MEVHMVGISLDVLRKLWVWLVLIERTSTILEC